MSEQLSANLDIIQSAPIDLKLLDGDLNIIQKLDDEPNDVGGLTSAELKAKFDESGNIIKKYINETLIPAILASDATEAERTAAEETRQSNEETRQSNEETRQSNEETRKSNETERKTSEASRASAEAARETAEKARADETAGIVAQATAQAKAAESSALEAKSAQSLAETSERNASSSAQTAQSASMTATGAASTASTAAEAASGSAYRAKASAADAAESIKHAPRINADGKWELWDATQGAYVATEYTAIGKNGTRGRGWYQHSVKASNPQVFAWTGLPAAPKWGEGDWLYNPDNGNVGICTSRTDNADGSGDANITYTGTLKGTDGTTPHIGANGNWFLGETDTGVKAAGTDYVLTAADKSEIAALVLAEIPNGDEVAYG